MTEQHASAGRPRDEQQPPGMTSDTARHVSHRRQPHMAGADGTMEQMLNEALGRAARQLKIDPQTGILLPGLPPDAEPAREPEAAAATGTPAQSDAKSGTGAGADAEAQAPPTLPTERDRSE